MKNIKIFLLIIIINFLSGCTEPIHLDLETGPKLLVVESCIILDNKEQDPNPGGNARNVQYFYLSTTAGYYEPIPEVNGASVRIEDEDGNVFDFIQEPGNIRYVSYDFLPAIGKTYKLIVIYNNETYTSTKTFLADKKPDERKDLEKQVGGFFKPPSKTVRGNIINNTNDDNYCIGNFRFFQSPSDYFYYKVGNSGDSL